MSSSRNAVHKNILLRSCIALSWLPTNDGPRLVHGTLRSSIHCRSIPWTTSYRTTPSSQTAAAWPSSRGRTARGRAFTSSRYLCRQSIFSWLLQGIPSGGAVLREECIKFRMLGLFSLRRRRVEFCTTISHAGPSRLLGVSALSREPEPNEARQMSPLNRVVCLLPCM